MAQEEIEAQPKLCDWKRERERKRRIERKKDTKGWPEKQFKRGKLRALSMRSPVFYCRNLNVDRNTIYTRTYRYCLMRCYAVKCTTHKTYTGRHCRRRHRRCRRCIGRYNNAEFSISSNNETNWILATFYVFVCVKSTQSYLCLPPKNCILFNRFEIYSKSTNLIAIWCRMGLGHKWVLCTHTHTHFFFVDFSISTCDSHFFYKFFCCLFLSLIHSVYNNNGKHKKSNNSLCNSERNDFDLD